MDNLRRFPGASQPKDGWQPTQSDSPCSCRNDATTSGVTNCPAIAADGGPAPSLRVACDAEKFSWHKHRLTAKTVSNFPRHVRSVCLLVSEADLRSNHSHHLDSSRPRKGWSKTFSHWITSIS